MLLCKLFQDRAAKIVEFKSSRGGDEDEEGKNCDDGLSNINTTNV